jgi:hypothetical protein
MILRASVLVLAIMTLSFPTIRPESSVTTHARGTFDVKITPVAADTAAEGVPLARMSIDKRFHGYLDGTSRGEMLSAGSPQTGSAGYVAVERVTGTVNGRAGTFALQHWGTMSGGTQELRIAVVPGSGTAALTGLAGTMTIVIADGKHSYDFDYTIGGH